VITGADVQAYRERRHLSRKALATEVGLTEGKVWRIEHRNVIHDDERRRLELAGVTAVTIDDATTPAPPTVTVTDPPIALIGPNTSVPATEDDLRPFESVDLAALARLAATSYDRYVSNSELQTWKRCRRKWWLGWFRGLKLRAESPVGARQVGDRCHRALKGHYVPGGPTKPDQMLDELERLIVLDRTALGDVDPETRKRFEQEADLERAMLEGYVEWLAETGADADYEVIAPETYLEAWIPEPDGVDGRSVAIIGKLDVRLRRRSDGARLFMDHKTVGDLRTPTLTLALDEQMLHYHLLELLNLPDDGVRAAGALYNMLKRSKRTDRARPPFYQRVEVQHNDHELESYRRRVAGEIADIFETEENLDRGGDHRWAAYPSPRRDCTWDCIFFAVCPMFDDGSRAEAMLEQLYVKTDPLEYYIDRQIGGTE
jgi:Zierdtviridae exonuclease